MRLLKKLSLLFISILVIGFIYIFAARPDLYSRVKLFIASTKLIASPKLAQLIPDNKNLAMLISSDNYQENNFASLLNTLNGLSPLLKNSIEKDLDYLNFIKKISEQEIEIEKIENQLNQFSFYIKQLKTIDPKNQIFNLSFSLGALIKKELDINLTQIPGKELLDSISIFATLKIPTPLPLLALSIFPNFVREEGLKQFESLVSNEMDFEKRQQLEIIKTIIQSATIERSWSKGYPLLKFILPSLNNLTFYLATMGYDSFIFSSDEEAISQILDSSYQIKNDPYIKDLSSFTKNKFLSLSLNINSILDNSPQLALMGRMFIKSLNALSFDLILNNKISSSINIFFEKDDDVNFFKTQVSSILNSQISKSPEINIFEPEIVTEKNSLSIQSKIEFEKIAKEFKDILDSNLKQQDLKISKLQSILEIKNKQNLKVINLQNSKLNEGKGLIFNQDNLLPFTLLTEHKSAFIPQYLFASVQCTGHYGFSAKSNSKKLKFINLEDNSDELKFKDEGIKYNIFKIESANKADTFILDFKLENPEEFASCKFSETPFLLVK